MEDGEIKTINLSGDQKSKYYFKKIFSNNIFLGVALVIIVIILSYFIFIYITQYEGCRSWDCFNENLASCKKTKFAGGDDIIFGYKIKGKDGKMCEVEVEFLQGEIADRTTKDMLNTKMNCKIPENVVMLPEADLSKCSGTLKEKLQERIISQLHNFIIQNLGQINKELLNPLLVNQSS